ncbi:hypothetical protein BH09SUM1_BH09SUM1_15640 [soil metagenome]
MAGNRFLATLIFMALGLVATGCNNGMINNLLGSVSKPEAKISDAKLEDFDAQSITLKLGVDVSNPYPLPLPMSDLKYTLSAGNDLTKSLVSGGTDSGPTTIPAHGTKTLQVPVKIQFADLLQSAQGIKLGQMVPYKAGVTVMLKDPTTEKEFEIPLEHSGEAPVPAPPHVTVSSFAWDKMSMTSAAGSVKLNVRNDNAFAATLTKLSYGLKLNGASLLDGVNEDGIKLDPGASQDLTIPFSISPMKLGAAGLQMMQGKPMDYELDGLADLSTPFGPLKLNYGSKDKVETAKQ